MQRNDEVRVSGWVVLASLLLCGCIQESRRSGTTDGGADTSTESDATPPRDVEVELVACRGCVIADTCRDEGEANPLNACEVCDTTRSADAWSAATDARPCEDDDPCTSSGICVEGRCQAPLRPECELLPECAIDVECVGPDCSYTIAEGSCLIDGQCFSDGQGPQGDPCRVCDSEASSKEWTFTRSSCDDNDECTHEDLCDGAGSCQGQLNDCSDQFDCTLDFCDGGECQHQVASDRCLVADTCFRADESARANPCMKCVPATSRVRLTPTPNAACDDDDPCTAESTCSPEGICEGTRVDREGEPNDTVDEAVDLGSVTVPAAFPSGTEGANLGDGDVDLYRWNLNLTEVSIYRPRAEARFSVSGAVELCLYLRCGQAPLEFAVAFVGCGEERTAHALDGVTVGCCRTFAPGDAVADSLNATCFPEIPRGQAFARVRSLGAVDAESCGGYELDWGSN